MTIHYRHHPFYGEQGKLVRRLRRYTTDSVVIQLQDEIQVAVPGWMLAPVVCQQLRDEAHPRLAVSALLALRQLLESQPLLSARQTTTSGRVAQRPGGKHARLDSTVASATDAAVESPGGLGAAPR